MPEIAFLERLKQRKFIQWAIAYLACGFAVVQLIDAVKEELGLSLAGRQAILGTLAVGFFITLVLAWYHGEKGRQRVSGAELLLLAVLLVGGAYDVGSTFMHSVYGTPGRVATEARKIAVLPFLDASAHGDQADVADGIADAILRLLGTVPGLDVVDRNSSFDPRVVAAAAEETGEMLGVDVLVGGSVEELRDTVHLTAKLIETTDGAELWHEDFSWTASQFAVGEAAWAIADYLLGGSDDPHGLSAPALSIRSHEALHLYFRAVQAASTGDRPGLESAVQYFSAAIQRDPDFAQAWAGLADAYLYLASDEAALTMAGVAVDRALALDSTSAEAHTVKGRLLNRPGNWIDAERELRTALQLRPSYAPAYMWLGNNLLTRGQTAEGIRAFRRAAELDPLSAQTAVGLSQALSAAGDLEGARVEALRATETSPKYPWGHTALAIALADLGLFDDAIPEADLAVCLLNQHPNALATLGAIHAQSGNRAEARAILQKLRRQEGTDALLPTALVYANLAEMDSAFSLLRRVPSWTPGSRDWLRNSPIWRPVREDPRWAEFLRYMGMN
jgi:TolB-like protein/Flp pilus assembly protein TadD